MISAGSLVQVQSGPPLPGKGQIENAPYSRLNEKEQKCGKLTVRQNEFTLTATKPSRAKNLGVSKAISVFFDNYT